MGKRGEIADAYADLEGAERPTNTFLVSLEPVSYASGEISIASILVDMLKGWGEFRDSDLQIWIEENSKQRGTANIFVGSNKKDDDRYFFPGGLLLETACEVVDRMKTQLVSEGEMEELLRTKYRSMQ